MEIGFDNDQYLELQSQKIAERLNEFGGKLYLEFGGKLFDDYHASRVLPGFAPDSKVEMLTKVKDDVEIVIVIKAEDIAQNKLREDIGIAYDEDVLRLYDAFTQRGLFVGSIVISQFSPDNIPAVKFKRKLERNGIKVYKHYKIDGYPTNVQHVVSDDGLGKNDYIETSRKIVVVTAPGPGSGKMATCMSQLYHDGKRGIKSGYAKFETFPVWNLPLNHPLNIAYESATADLDDVNMIDPWHLLAYGESAVNYNRDIEVFPVLNTLFTKLLGSSPYKSPTDMGVNMVGKCISNDEVCCEASKQEIIRRYLIAQVQYRKGNLPQSVVDKLGVIMSKLGLSDTDRAVVAKARATAIRKGTSVACVELPNGKTITGKTTSLLSCSSTMLLNALKALAGINDDKVKLISPQALVPIQTLKKQVFGETNGELHADETLLALSVSACDDELAKRALNQLPKLRGCQVHATVIPYESDAQVFRKLGLQATSDATYLTKRMFVK